MHLGLLQQKVGIVLDGHPVPGCDPEDITDNASGCAAARRSAALAAVAAPQPGTILPSPQTFSSIAAFWVGNNSTVCRIIG